LILNIKYLSPSQITAIKLLGFRIRKGMFDEAFLTLCDHTPQVTWYSTIDHKWHIHDKHKEILEPILCPQTLNSQL
jgi:hypothetical protein